MSSPSIELNCPPAFVAAGHTFSASDLLSALQSTEGGLSTTEVCVRRQRHGANELPAPQAAGPWRLFLRQFASPLIYILLAAAAVSAVFGDWSDAGFIGLVLTINAVIGSLQEHSAEKSARALQELSSSRALVQRDGAFVSLDAAELVPGDIVRLETGDKVPADMRLVTAMGLETDESWLTGESFAVRKIPDAVLPVETALGDRLNMAFAATWVTRGRALGVVVATGLHTQLGHIAASLSHDAGKPPLLVRMERFTRKVAVSVLVSVSLLGAVAIVRGNAPAEVFMLAVALAVSAIPEGLPVALTVALSIGSRRMNRRGVIARRLVAVEALGSCTFIASDKTGTLTLNALTARKVGLAGGVSVDLTDIEPVSPIDEETMHLLHRTGAAVSLCNDALVDLRDGHRVSHGDTVDIALLNMADRMGLDRRLLTEQSRRIAEIPFESEQGFAATLHRLDRKATISVKGSDEKVLPMCTHMATSVGDQPIDPMALRRQAAVMAAAGYRVLAVASGTVETEPTHPATFDRSHLHGLVFLGFVGMIDPLRPEARQAVQSCQAAGIQVAMVTGDHPVTALAIARELGMATQAHEVVTGPMLAEVAASGTDAVDALVGRARVFARVEPAQKLQIVQSLTRLGHFVAVTGDGANDAPALRAAHIGVAMGQRGTDVARENADLIITDDNISSLVAGVEEGRIAYGNVRKVVYLLVSSGAAEVLLFTLTTAAGLPVPLWPAQLLWLNLVTNGIQDVALAFEPGEGGELQKPPRAPREPVFNRLMIERTVVSALVIAGIGFAAYRWMLAHGWPLTRAQSGLLLLLVLFENIQAGNSRSETRSLLRMSPLRNRFLFVGTAVAQVLHLVALYTPGLKDILRLEHVTLKQWMVSLALALTLLLVSELHKSLLRRRAGRAPPSAVTAPT